jgi:hypothetical protein
MSDEKSTDVELYEADNVKTVVDIAAGLVLAAMSVFALFWLFPNYIVSGSNEYDVGPEFFPKLAAWTVFGLSIVLIISRVIRFELSVNGRSGKSIVFEIVVWAMISALTLVGLLKIGFLITAPLIISLGALASGYRIWWVIAMLAIAFPLLLDQAAWMVFTVDLP